MADQPIDLSQFPTSPDSGADTIDLSKYPTSDEIVARRQGRTGFGQWYNDTIGQPMSQIVQAGIGPLTAVAKATPVLGPMLGGRGDLNPLPDIIGAGGQPSVITQPPSDLAKFLNPYETPTKAAISLSMGAGGGLGPLGRLGVSGAAGAAGGAAEYGTPSGAVSGAAQGVFSRGTGELVGWGLSKLKGSGLDPTLEAPFNPTRTIRDLDAKRAGDALETIPRLKGVFSSAETEAPLNTPRGLYDLAHGVQEVPAPNGGTMVVNKGQYALSQRMEQANTQIKGLLGDQANLARFPNPLAPNAPNPQASRVPDILSQVSPARLAEIKAANPGLFPDEVKGTGFVTWDEARRNLSKLGERLASATGTERYDLSQQYEQSKRLLMAQLSKDDPTGQAAKIFADASQTYRAGLYVLGLIKDGFAAGGEAAKSTVWNSQAVKAALNKNNTEAAQALGTDGLTALRAALNALPGRNDVLNPGSLLPRVVEHVTAPVPGVGRVGAYAGARLNRPDLMGNPLGLSPNARLNMQIGTGTAANDTVDQFTRNLLQSRGYTK